MDKNQSQKKLMEDIFKHQFNSKIAADNFRSLSKTPKLQQIKFPSVELVRSGDIHYENVWKMIDGAEDYIVVLMYHFDSTHVGNITLFKLTQAAKRGVEVNILHDVLVSELDSELTQEFESAGGRYSRLGDFYKIWRMTDRSYFKRDHEKVILADNMMTLGSSNISSDYASKRHGESFFHDLNLLSQNCCLQKTREFMLRVANFHGVEFSENRTNEDYINLKSIKFPDSLWTPKDYKIIQSYQPDTIEIQNYIIKKIQTSQKSIKIISPYYIPMDNIEDEIIKAANRGIKVELITAQNRDIPAYKTLVNSRLMSKLIKNGVSVFQMKDKYLHMKSMIFDDLELTFGSFNLDKWSWNNNNELNFCSKDPRLANELLKIYQGVKDESVLVQRWTPLKLWESMEDSFWMWFLDGCNFTMNYRRLAQTTARDEALEKMYFDRIIQGKVPNSMIDSDINLYRRVYCDWDDVFGVDQVIKKQKVIIIFLLISSAQILITEAK